MLVNRRPGIREQRDDLLVVEAERVLDGAGRAKRTAVREHVAADLAEGGLEEDEREVVGAPSGGEPKPLDGLVQDVKSFTEIGKRGAELKSVAPHGLKAGEGFLDCRVVGENP